MSISPWQILIIIIILLLLFGPKRLPALGQAIGKALRDFKKGLEGKDNSENINTKNESLKDDATNQNTTDTENKK